MNSKLESDEIWLEVIDRWRSEEQQIIAPEFSLDNDIAILNDNSKSVSTLFRLAGLGGVVLVVGIVTNLFISPHEDITIPLVTQIESNDPWLAPSSPCAEASSCLDINNYMEK